MIWLISAVVAWAVPPSDDAVASVADARPSATLPSFPRSVAVRSGEVARITPTEDPANAARNVEWVGADGQLVVVEYDGYIVGLQEGTTEVRPVVDGRVGRPVRIEIEPSPVVTMLLDGAPTQLTLGESVAVRAMAYRRDLTFADVSERAVWTTSDPSIVSIDENGRLVAVGTGSVHVDAWLDGQVARSGSIYVF